ncbi:hypothetical protein [Microbulbifer sp. S227A]|uniref:hypothetical protein n=1 Tax=Microbulbifer sp. S227A TaxID=3415131 RepID=UPI003C7CC294
MRFAIAALLVCVVCVPPVHAGAWLREHKTSFLSFGSTVRGNKVSLPDYETKIYAEYGLFPGMTLGVDVNDVRAKSAHALLFARFPIGKADNRTRYAVEIGVGKHRQQMQWFPMYKAALAVGRGFESRWGNGWMGAELAYEVRSALPDPALKLDLVAGLSSGPRIRPLLKLETAYVPNQPFSWSFTPGIMFDVGESIWVLGLEGRSATQRTIGLTFNIWRSF